MKRTYLSGDVPKREEAVLEKVVVKVCVGTTCYVLGGSELTDFARQIPPAWKDRVAVEGTVCLDLCRNSGRLKPPFVQVGDQVVDQASVEKVLGVLRGVLA
jgi:iron-hydrogenase subunit alpha